MSWKAAPNRRYARPRRDESPKRYVHRPPRWQGRLLSEIISWCLCFVVILVIVLWPKHADTSLKPRQKGPISPSLPIAPHDVDSHNGIKKPKKKRPTLESTEHIYRPDGLLDVNPRGKHPVFELIERSETQWKRKVERQSKTLKQAVREYKRRYKRSPPKGFEIWWDYADFHDVKLIDEYDSIHAHLQPFWAVPPTTLIATQAAWESHPDTYTIGKIPGSHQVELLHDTMNGSFTGHERAQQQLELFEDVQEWLPEFRATFIMGDGPTQFVSWELRKRAEEAAEKGEFIDVEQIAASVATQGWAAACPPASPIHSYVPPPLPPSPPPPTRPVSFGRPSSSPKTFIHNHPLAMSPCLHPTHITNIGYLSQHRYPRQYGPSPANYLAPTFSMCVSPLHSDILVVAPEQFADEVHADPDWADKVDERLLWRGSNTGVEFSETNEWNASQRIRLVEMGTRRGGETTVLMPRNADGDGRVGHGESVRTSALNAAFMDVAFVDGPIQCKDTAMCDKLEHMYEWRKYQESHRSWMYKYIIDVDGNGWSARFKRLMTSRSLILKSTIFPEWYTERIMPWVHYIPVQVDFSDIYDILAFFRGDLSGAGGHDDIAEKIATAGREWSKTFYRREDMTAYHFRLFLEYARVMSLDRVVMNYDEDEDELNYRQRDTLEW